MTVLLWGLGLAVWGAAIVGVGVGVVYAFRARDNYPVIPFPAMRVLMALILAAVVIVPAAFITGDLSFTSIPDGCYRVGSTTSTSVALIPTGKGVSVVPIVSSGKTYSPIACPS